MGIVTKYLVTVDGNLKADPLAAGQFFRFFSKKNRDFNAILIIFRTFWIYTNN